jgi:hypothetical protein
VSGPSIRVLELWGQACTSMYLVEPWDQACTSVYLVSRGVRRVREQGQLQVADRPIFYSSVSETGADGIITVFASSSDLLARGGRVLQGGPHHPYRSDHQGVRRAVLKPLSVRCRGKYGRPFRCTGPMLGTNRHVIFGFLLFSLSFCYHVALLIFRD